MRKTKFSGVVLAAIAAAALCMNGCGPKNSETTAAATTAAAATAAETTAEETTAEETILSARKNATVIEQEAILKAQSIVADSKIELEKVKVQFSELLRQYDSYRAQYKALAQAQMDLLDSKAFDLEASSAASMEMLEKSASEHADQLQAGPVHNDPLPEKEAAQNQEEPEDEADETLGGDKTLIKEFSDIFDENV